MTATKAGTAHTPAQKRAIILAKKAEESKVDSQVQGAPTKAPKKERIPLGVPRKKLDATPIPGYHLHWVNDYPGRVQEAIDGGYEFVHADETKVNNFVTQGNSDLGTLVKRRVGVDEKGDGLFAYLMKIDEDLWMDDQAELQLKNDQIDDAIRRGELNRVDSQYGSVKIS
jgi:hypothetical protein